MDRLKYDVKINTAEMNSSHMELLQRIDFGEKVLELGCATGYFSQLLSQQLNCYVVGVDIDQQATEQASHFCKRVIVADLDTDDLAEILNNETFDVIVFADVLEHLKDPVAALKRLKSLLNKKGRILISIPNLAHASIRLELLQGHFDYQKLGLLDETHLHFYTRDSALNMLAVAGFASTDIGYTVHDMADEAIHEHFQALGLTSSQDTLDILHAPDAQAYQFIIEAYPANPDVINDHYPELRPKPLDSSNTYYFQKQQKIDQLQQQLIPLQEHSAQLEQQRDDMDQYLENLRRHVNDLEQVNNLLLHEKNQAIEKNKHLEGVLERVHNKKIYKLLQVFRRIAARVQAFFAKSNVVMPANSGFVDFLKDYPEWVLRCDTFTDNIRRDLQKKAEHLQNPPLIAILMPVYNTDQEYLQAAIESVLGQVYSHWELCIADDGSDAPHVREVLESYSKQDPRIKVVYLKQNAHIAAASNKALELVTAENVALMDHDDVLAPDALFWVVNSFIEQPSTKLIYTDEDKIDIEGQRYNAYFKPDWNPALSLSHNFVCHLGVYKTELVNQLGGFRAGFDGAQDYDLMLRYVETIEAQEILHIPRVLYHWRAIPGSTAIGLQEKPYAESAILKAVSEALQRRSVSAQVLKHETIRGAIRVKYSLPNSTPLVSIIIPTRNAYEFIRRCISSIINKTSYKNYEIIVVDNGSDEVDALSYLRYLQQRDGVKVIRDERAFNYAALNNEAVKQANGSVIALLNNDLEVIDPDWLQEMVSHAIRPEIGAVGAKLYYPNDTIQHAGVIIGLGGVAGHSHKHFPRSEVGYSGRLHLIQNLSAVTAACMVLEKSVFEQAGGFDENHLKVAFNDVDLCLKIKQLGYMNLWTPYTQFYHFESATRGYEDTPEKQGRFNQEVEFMKTKWGPLLQDDPAYNVNLTLKTEDFALKWPE